MLIASCKSNEVEFSYSPEEPAIGETVRFSNTTENGEDWAWNFGDGTTSTSKSPSKIYKKPGTYTVVLKVDDKASRTCTKTITVHDSVPAIGISDSIVNFYQPVQLSVDAYNPYSHQTSVQWELPANAKLIAGELTDKQITVCFTQLDAQNVKCAYQQGEKAYQLDTTIQVEDYAARSLVFARGKLIYHQRIYDYGYEEAIAYPVAASAVTAPSALCCTDDWLYIFNADRTTAGTLSGYDQVTGKTETLAQNAQAAEQQGFDYGYVANGLVYWTAADGVYQLDINARNTAFTAGALSAQKVAMAAQLGLTAGKQSGGVIVYNGVVLYAYDKGVVRFDKNNPASLKGSILSEFTIRCMALDRVSQKLYFAAEKGLYVATLNGEYPVLLDATANGKSIAVDADDNKLFFTTDEGVKEMPLVHSPNNETQQKASLVNSFGDVTALTVDASLRAIGLLITFTK